MQNQPFQLSRRRRKGNGWKTVLVLTACFFPSLCYGAWQAVGYTVNILTTASLSAQIEEDYLPVENLMPSQTVKKVVHVKNTGRTDAIVRVRVEKAFGKTDSRGVFIKDEAMDTNSIRIHYNDSGLWKHLPDGYVYYCRILKPGETTQEPLMDSYTLSPAAEKEQGMEGRIRIHMESVQAEGNAVSQWGVTREQLGIPLEEEKPPEEKTLLVTFDGTEQTFSFSEPGPDLFACFKELLPGTEHTEKIRIENRSDTETVMTLKVVALKQLADTEVGQSLVRNLLDQYTQVDVREGDKLLYEGPAGGKKESEAIPLGTFQPHEKKELTVRLKVSPEMNNSYQKLSGKVGWVFGAGGGIYSEYPYTADDTPLKKMIFLLVSNAFAAAVLLFRLHRRKQDA